MANVFIKISTEFLLKDSEDAETPIIKRLKDDGYGALSADILLPSGVFLAFRLMPDNLVEGDFTVTPVGKKLKVKCDGIFKLALKPDHLEDFLNADSKWVYGGLRDKYLTLFEADVDDGLNSEAYTYKNRFGEGEGIRHLISVKTGTKAKDLK